MIEYIRPTTLSEALEVIKKYPDCRLIAGGTDVMVDPALTPKPGQAILDLSRIDQLRQLELVQNQLYIGASITFKEMENSPLIPHEAEALKIAASQIGSPQIRNIATVGGNLGTASPGGDMNVALMGMRTKILVASPEYQRYIPIEHFFRGAKQNVLENDEIIVRAEISLPKRSSYRKLGLRQSLALAITALSISQYADGQWYLAYAALAPTPVRCIMTQQLLTHGCNIADACTTVKDEVMHFAGKRRNSLRGSIEYKQEMAAELLRETLIKWALN